VNGVLDMPAAQPFEIFLSHHSKDKPLVRQLAEALKARRRRVWLDDANAG
jgi:hypothetical protein